MNYENTKNQILEKLKNYDKLTDEEVEKALKVSYYCLENDETYNDALFIICNISDDKYSLSDYQKKLLKENIIKSRIFIYLDMNKFELTNLTDYISKEFYTINETETTLTKNQKELVSFFNKNRKVIVSAPTSFGKSRVTDEIITLNREKYSNIAIIVPTNALLSETYIRFVSNKLLSKEYNLISSTKQKLKRKNILIFTPEKMIAYFEKLNEENITIDFFVMDEIYKLDEQNDPERHNIFAYCLFELWKTKADFYLLGPYFDNFSPMFLTMTKSRLKKFTNEIVQKNVFKKTYDSDTNRYFIKIGNNNIKLLKSNTNENMMRILEYIDKGNTIFYTNTKDYAQKKAEYLAKEKSLYKNRNKDLIKFLETNIHKDWSLVKLLEKGIGYHHSAIPRFVQNEILDSFNKNKLEFLFSTTSITEGVNTNAKNVVILSNKKNDSNLKGFDYKNIKGRAGRLGHHFIGNVYIIADEEIKEDNNIKNIEYKYFEDNILSDEELLQIDKDYLHNDNKTKLTELELNLVALGIPIELLKKNKFIDIDKQIRFIKMLEKDFYSIYNNCKFNFMPENHQVEPLLKHIAFFANKFERKRILFLDNGLDFIFIKRFKEYLYTKDKDRGKLFSKLLQADTKTTNIDTKIRNVFEFYNKYLEFVLPKYLKVIESLINHVAKKKNYDEISFESLITFLEYGFLEEHQCALKDAGVPSMIIEKISKNFKGCQNIADIRNKCLTAPYILSDISSFEKQILKKYIG